MGGIGSGNRWRLSTKPICEHQKRIDIRFMRQRGFLKPGFFGKLTWTRGDEDAGWIQFRSHPNSLELDYRFRESGGDWTPINERVWLSRKAQHFGGERVYFTCPGCHRNCMVLYGGAYFRCRNCHGLAYASQNEDVIDRLRRRADKKRKRVGGFTGEYWHFPAKPKGMHWRTYDRLFTEWEALEDEHEVMLARRIGALADMP